MALLPSLRERSVAVLRAPVRTNERLLLLTILGSYFSVLSAGHFVLGDYVLMWQKMGVFSMHPVFADLSAITGGWDSIRLGHDPMVYNPAAAWGLPLNYPRVWQWLVVLGLGREHTIPIGIGIILLFFGVSVFVLMRKPNRAEAVIYALILTSPAVMMGIDRANIDLFIFALVAVAGHLIAQTGTRYRLGKGLLGVAMILKIYPLFGIFYVLRASRRETFVRASLALGAAALFIFLIAEDLPRMAAGTHQPMQNAFGVNVFVDELSRYYGHKEMLRIIALSLAGLLTVFTAAVAYRRANHFQHEFNREHVLYVLGAGIYCGIFLLLGNSYDYRMMFLLLTVPQAVRWVRQSEQMQVLALAYLAAVVITLWTNVWRLPLWKLIPDALVLSLESGESLRNAEYALSFITEELLNWFLLGFHTYALFSIAFYWLSVTRIQADNLEVLAQMAVSTDGLAGSYWRSPVLRRTWQAARAWKPRMTKVRHTPFYKSLKKAARRSFGWED